MSIKHCIDTDLKWNSTPDLPKLRYAQKIPIFLWDDLIDFTTFSATMREVAELSKNYRSISNFAVTVEKFIPWYNLSDSSSRYNAYCFREVADVANIDLPEYSIDKPLPMRGKRADVSLAILQALDVYYENERDFERYLIWVKDSTHSVHHKLCYTWLNKEDQVLEFDSKTSEYVPASGIDLTPFRTEELGNQEFYSF